MHLFSEKGVGHLFLTAFYLAVLKITLYYPVLYSQCLPDIMQEAIWHAKLEQGFAVEN